MTAEVYKCLYKYLCANAHEHGIALYICVLYAYMYYCLLKYSFCLHIYIVLSICLSIVCPLPFVTMLLPLHVVPFLKLTVIASASCMCTLSRCHDLVYYIYAYNMYSQLLLCSELPYMYIHTFNCCPALVMGYINIYVSLSPLHAF